LQISRLDFSINRYQGTQAFADYASNTAPVNELRKKAISGIGWRGFADVSQLVLQITFTAILARLLGLAEFGLAAMCLIFLRFVNALTNVGFSSSVIQSQTITPSQVSGIFVVQLLIKCAVFGIAVLAAPLAASFFDQPQLVDLIRVLACLVLFEGLAFPQTVALKQLRFRGYSLLELAALSLSGTLGIVMALNGFGVWSLIARIIAEKALFAVSIWPVVGWRPVRPSFRGLKPHIRFGFTMLSASAVYFFSQHLAAIIIGKFIGVETLGLYNVAYNLGIVPAQKIQSIFATVMMPAFAGLQSDLARMRRAIRTAFFSVGFFFVPLMLGLSAVGTSFMLTVYGPKWAQAGEFLTFLSLIGLLKGLEHILRSVLMAAGRAKTILQVTAIEAVVAAPLLWIASVQFGVWGVILAYSAVSILAFGLTGFFVQRHLVDSAVLVLAFGRTIVAGAAMMLAVLPLPMVLQLPAPQCMAVQILVGIAVYAAVRWPLFTDDERRMIRTWPFFRGKSTAP